MVIRGLEKQIPYQSCVSNSSLFAEICKDSKTPLSSTLGKTKCSYVIRYGIAPYCKGLLMGVLEGTAFVAILFDELVYISIKKGQRQVHV